MALAHGFGLRLWLTALAHSFGSQLWLTALAHGFGSRLWGTALGQDVEQPEPVLAPRHQPDRNPTTPPQGSQPAA
ncbi:MAG: hypothetical protein QNL18_01515 [Pseudomonadales bacterium]